MIKEFEPSPYPEGQFVAVWEYNELLWSDVFLVKNGQVMRYDEEMDTFYATNLLSNIPHKIFTNK